VLLGFQWPCTFLARCLAQPSRSIMALYYTLCIGSDSFASRLPALAAYGPALAYGYVGLAILTDDYLLPAVAHCAEALGAPSEVASSLMEAAASSVAEVAPIIESALFTDDDVGTESFLASAMIKMLVVVGTTALASPVAELVNWRPLVGDGCFFSIMIAALVLVSYALTPQWAHWFEGLLVLLLYAVYGVFVFVAATPLSTILHRTWPRRGAGIVGVAGERHGDDAIDKMEDATEEDATSYEPGPARDGARRSPQSVAALRAPGADTSQPHLVDGAVPVSTNSRTDRHPSSSATSDPIEGNVQALSHRRTVGDTAPPDAAAVAGDVTSQAGTADSSEEQGHCCIVRPKVVAFTTLRVVTAPWRLLFWVLFLDHWRTRQARQSWPATMAAALIYMYGLSYAILQAARWIDCLLEKETNVARVQALLLAIGTSRSAVLSIYPVVFRSHFSSSCTGIVLCMSARFALSADARKNAIGDTNGQLRPSPCVCRLGVNHSVGPALGAQRSTRFRL